MKNRISGVIVRI